MNKLLLILITILTIIISCNSSNRLQKTNYSPIVEEKGIIVYRNEEFNWFIPLISFDKSLSLLKNFSKENSKTGLQFDYRHDDKYFSFFWTKNLHKEIYYTSDSLRIELIPAIIKYKKFDPVDYKNCENETHKNSFIVDNIKYEYYINHCVYFVESIIVIDYKSDDKD